MLVLFAASFGDYKNFAPIFSIAVLVVMFSSVTLIPALFTLLGRRAFWPKIPRVGDEGMRASSLWSKVGKFVSTRPIVSVVVILVFLLVSASHLFTVTYEYNTMKSFPDDMPSRVGYDVLEEKFSKGTLAPTTVILESEQEVTQDEQQHIAQLFKEIDLVESARVSNTAEDDH